MSQLVQQVQAALADDQGEALIALAKERAQRLAKRVKTAQLRKLFYEIRGIEAEWLQGQQDPQRRQQALRRLTLLKPKLAYQTARHEQLRPLQAVIDPAIDHVLKHPETFPRLIDLFEAILAYFYELESQSEGKSK